MNGSERRRPKYAAIAEDLDAKIKSGLYEPGQPLPAQRELSAAYGVTLMTLRQALQLLTERGLVSQQAGRGTFVAAPKASYSLGSMQSLADDLRAQGHAVETALLGRSRRRPPRRVADQLGVDPAVPALRIERLRRLDGTPAIHQVSWVPAVLADALSDVDFTATPLYSALATAGVVVQSARERLSPGVLTAPLAKHLGQPAGTPVFLSDRVTHGLDDSAVVFDRATILGELVEIRTVRAATSLSMHWTSQSP
ncbi:MAG TPA: GntR family transcriptional regulator [Pseudonocardia sp.]|nr:GntR family transcriptional regulator [Pseudonocardiales bacterium]MDT7598946.1 GntR family transcriptional regulator [Pseudonocardiales bacterium]MDT7694438.1 GntR family transcriptional regulator [Pseudonocardiales bacterium]MDT7747127.1 GntR family transcriptional regulator [Pseudonocardiales bacterium]